MFIFVYKAKFLVYTHNVISVYTLRWRKNMNTNKKLTQYAIAALLIAIALIIPTYFGFLRIYIPPFSATVAAHVPIFIAMMINPLVALLVGIGSTISFAISGLPIVVTARASSHILWALVGAYLMKKKVPYVPVLIITMLIHGIYEGLIIIPFTSPNLSLILITTFGTMAHHLIDGIISYIIAKPLEKALKVDLVGKLFK